MNTSFFLSVHFFWIILVIINFVVQLVYFFNDGDIRLFRTKKVTTPLLLFAGLAIVVIKTGTFPVIPGVILLAMALGELGIEGSSVVESGEEKTSVVVILAGVLFLLVNIFIGGFLIFKGNDIPVILFSGLISALIIAVMLLVTIKVFGTRSDIRTQMILYSLGLAVLMTGALSDAEGGISFLGKAALVLSVSDSLVLIRMGANFDKKTKKGFGILLGFLIVILLLYYLYMGIMIEISAPFPL